MTSFWRGCGDLPAQLFRVEQRACATTGPFTIMFNMAAKRSGKKVKSKSSQTGFQPLIKGCTETVKSLNPYERWQVVTTIAQTLIALCALLAALYIGLKQVDISARQTEISVKQTAISESLLDISFTVSVDVVYEAATKRLNIYNKGQTNIYLWGTKLGNGPQVMEKAPMIITPGGFYYLLADALERDSLVQFPKDGEMRGEFLAYVTNQNGTKYVITNNVLVKITNGECSVHTQTISIKPQEW